MKVGAPSDWTLCDTEPVLDHVQVTLPPATTVSTAVFVVLFRLLRKKSFPTATVADVDGGPTSPPGGTFVGALAEPPQPMSRVVIATKGISLFVLCMHKPLNEMSKPLRSFQTAPAMLLLADPAMIASGWSLLSLNAEGGSVLRHRLAIFNTVSLGASRAGCTTAAHDVCPCRVSSGTGRLPTSPIFHATATVRSARLRAVRDAKLTVYRGERVDVYRVVDLDARTIEWSTPDDPRLEVLRNALNDTRQGAQHQLVIDLEDYFGVCSTNDVSASAAGPEDRAPRPSRAPTASSGGR